ncbi:MAG: ribosome biogenesis/translation initiation ATPase RLI [Candidatus Nitrosocaldus sp.]|nr:ribosome biogenesis/translation initiation ATPase RLI [Candidatus Nitrosocaldus sp.]
MHSNNSRVAVIDRDLCKPRNCSLECIAFCPLNRDGGKCITLSEEDRSKAIAVIDEDICNGCGICVKKCPFEAITIVNLAEELEERKVHQYAQNSFRLYNIPVPRSGAVVGLLGRNGIGKSTVLNIVAGMLKPNLGRYEDEPSWDEVLEHFRGTAVKEHLKAVAEKRIRVAMKPQQVYLIAKVFRGTARELLARYDESGYAEHYASRLALHGSMDRHVDELSGGELQRLAVAVAASKEADLYLFDEPSSYNDVHQRLEVARVINDIASRGKSVMIVEHDLTMLDYLSDYVHVLYGEPGAYGIVSDAMSTNTAINEFLQGYLSSINVRFRDRAFRFEGASSGEDLIMEEVVAEYTTVEKSHPGFRLIADGARIRKGEVVGVVGANALGKTTLMRMISGIDSPDRGQFRINARISYKPQYLEQEDYGYDVRTLLSEAYGKGIEGSSAEATIVEPLRLRRLYDKMVRSLSGGELQKVAIASCLLRDADIYAMDEPSAFLDVEDRVTIARFIQRFVKGQGRSAIVVDHDMHMVDMVADTLIVFTGIPGKEGHATGTLSKREGMNIFLKGLDVTFRRDEESNRPRINKLNSRLDRMQKEKGVYYAI